MKTKVAETDLAAVVVRHFLDLGAEVYQEVAPQGSYGARADIVAAYGPVLHVIECKTAFGLSVIGQALGWRHRAHRVSVAVPFHNRTRVAQQICEEFGVGVYGVKIAASDWETTKTEEIIPAKLDRSANVTALRKCLSEHQKTYAAAGNNYGRFWSPFKATCAALREVVETQQGLTWREALKRVKHHYSSDSAAASTLYRLAQGGRVADLEWLECSNERPARLYLKGAAMPPVQVQTPLGITESEQAIAALKGIS